MTSLADQLRHAIAWSGKTRYRIALESGISQAVLSRFVNNQRELSLSHVDTLCKNLGLRIVLQPSSGKKRRQNKSDSKG